MFACKTKGRVAKLAFQTMPEPKTAWMDGLEAPVSELARNLRDCRRPRSVHETLHESETDATEDLVARAAAVREPVWGVTCCQRMRFPDLR